ncbi:MAG: Radical SAM superfamily protein [Acidobacteria bacterium ADurb.Bin340]|nr:MAG: Radical SAM superfamily protein [Acidobacteria bacterium ADurb.Bin340]
MVPLPFPPDLDPQGAGDVEIVLEEARSILRPQRDARHGFGFALSPYRGCAHGCRYCYVREYPNAFHPPEAWGRWLTPKTNAAALLWAQRHRLAGQKVFLASATDPYQPLEARFRLTRACLEVLLACPATQVLLHTRSPLVLQDLALLQAFGPRLSVGLSIPTDDDTVRQVTEPSAPPIPSRWAAVERLAAAGIRVGVSVAPLLPMVDPRAFARRAGASGAANAWVGGLRLIRQDPFYDLLAQQGWLRALDPVYVAEVRAILQEAMPAVPRAAPRTVRRAVRNLGCHAPSRGPSHPALFEGIL